MCFIDNASKSDQRIADRSRSWSSLSIRDNQESLVSTAQSQPAVSGSGCTEIDISLDRLTGNIVDYKVIPKPDDNGITEVLKHA